MLRLLDRGDAAAWRVRWARVVESPTAQRLIVAVILLNAAVLGLETYSAAMDRWGGLLRLADAFCLGVFLVELSVKLAVYRGLFWRNGWNWFDFFVVAVALVPGASPWAVLRSLRILRVLRLLTVVPQLRKVVAAFIHAIPGLSGVILVMIVFVYTMAVLATNLFGPSFPEYFGSLGRSLFTLFQIMTLESWSMAVVRPIMETQPLAWLFFVPFIVIATFTILNLFIGIIVSTMQELSEQPDTPHPEADLVETLERMEKDVANLRARLEQRRTDT